MKKPNVSESLRLPQVRACRICGRERMIASDGRCDPCYRAERRNEVKINLPKGKQQTQDEGLAWISSLNKMLNKGRVLREDKKRILEIALAYSGLNAQSQEDLVEDLAGEIEKTQTMAAGAGLTVRRREEQEQWPIDVPVKKETKKV